MKSFSRLRLIGILLVLLGVAGNVAYMKMHIEGIAHDLTRLLVIIGVVLMIWDRVKNRSKPS